MPSTRIPSLGPFILGVNDRRPDFDLRTKKDGNFLRGASNVDITSTGALRRREGYTKLISGSDCHSLTSDGTTSYLVDGQALRKITGLDTSPVATTIKSDMAVGKRVSYCPVGSDLVFSNGVQIGRIDAAGAHDLGVPGLAIPPLVAGSSGGSLPAGAYQLCFTFANAQGEQSGSTAPVTAAVTAGSIAISRLPATFPPEVTSLLVYMSPLNSDALLHVATLNTPQTTWSVVTPPSYGGRCPTLMLSAMPAGTIVRERAGRLFTAKGPYLFYSEPFAHALTNPERNYVAFNDDITVIETTDIGMYVVADQAYWLPGDILDTTPVSVLPYGATAGASGQKPDSNSVWWMSHRGLVTANSDGQAVNLQEDNVVVAKARDGAGLFRETRGLKQILASMFNVGLSGAAAHSFMDAEVVTPN